MLIQDITGVLATLIPGLLVIAALGMQRRSRWRIAKTVATTHLALALILAGLSFSQPDLRAATVEPSILHVSPLTGILLVLISFIGWVIVRFSEQYMGRGERDSHYLRWLLMTLAAVTLVLVSNHLLLFVAGWIGISLALHHLLMFYPERPRAALAAHKKFLFARVAELSLCGAALLLYNQHGTLYIQSILADYPVAELSWQQQLAACLLAVTALIKCAQLPVHGWLMQVVEAPTPVSALLHAGVINLGGFMLILFSPLLVQSTPAQWLILVIAGLTALLAALIMMTRISIKVKLAWSTSAQMGLMLVQCALGLFELALLHLLAHSCYKAYGFLSAGQAVTYSLNGRLAPAAPVATKSWLAGIGVSLLLTSAAVAASTMLAGPSEQVSPWILLFLMLSILFAETRGTTRASDWVRALGLGSLLVTAYVGQKYLAGWFASPLEPSAGFSADLWILLLMGLLALSYLLLRYHSDHRSVQRFRRQLFAGFYLDEWATRTTLKIWPSRLPVRANPKQPPSAFQEVTS